MSYYRRGDFKGAGRYSNNRKLRKHTLYLLETDIDTAYSARFCYGYIFL